MKILIFRTNGDIINITNYNSQEIGLAKSLVDAGHICDIVFFNGKNPSKIEEVRYGGNTIKIYWEHGFSIAGNGIFPKANRLFSEYDVIQLSEYDQLTSIYYMYFSSFKGKTILYHGPYYSDFKKKYNMKCRVVDCIPVSKKLKAQIPCAAKSFLAKKFLIQKGYKNITVTGVGLDTEKFDKRAPIEEETQSIINSISDSHIMLYIGQIEPRRNIKFLIHVVDKISKSNARCKLLMVGKGKNHQYVEECHSLIIELNLEKRIIWIDSMIQSQLPYLYEKAAVFLLPSNYEIFGMVMMEAMYFGLSVITTPNGGSTTVISNEEDGFIEELNLDKWTSLIERILNDNSLATRVGNAARQKIIDKFTWSSVAKKMIEVYRKVVVTK